MIFRMGISVHPDTIISGMMEMFWGGPVFTDQEGLFRMEGETRIPMEASADMLEFLEVCKSLRALYAKHFTESGERINNTTKVDFVNLHKKGDNS